MRFQAFATPAMNGKPFKKFGQDVVCVLSEIMILLPNAKIHVVYINRNSRKVDVNDTVRENP